MSRLYIGCNRTASTHFNTNFSSCSVKMDLFEEFDFLHDRDLQVDIFGKDLKRLYDGGNDCKIFVVVTNQDGDELYHPETLPEPDMSELRNWIRCGDPKGFGPEWKSAKISKYDAKIYLAGQDPGVDCTSVMDDMFVEEGGETYTYTYCREGIRKVSHPYESLSLSTSSLPLLHRKVLTTA